MASRYFLTLLQWVGPLSVVTLMLTFSSPNNAIHSLGLVLYNASKWSARARPEALWTAILGPYLNPRLMEALLRPSHSVTLVGADREERKLSEARGGDGGSGEQGGARGAGAEGGGRGRAHNQLHHQRPRWRRLRLRGRRWRRLGCRRRAPRRLRLRTGLWRVPICKSLRAIVEEIPFNPLQRFVAEFWIASEFVNRSSSNSLKETGIVICCYFRLCGHLGLFLRRSIFFIVSGSWDLIARNLW